MTAAETHPIRTKVWRNGVVEHEDFPFEDVSDYLEEPDTLVWADLVSPDAKTIAQLAEELSLDQHAVEDALAENARPKAVRYPTYVFITMYSLRCVGPDIEVGRVSVFMTKQAFVTVRLDNGVDVDDLVQRWSDNANLLKFGPRALLYGLLDEVVDGYFTAVQQLDDEIEGIGEILFDDQAESVQDVSRRTFALRRSMVQARRAISPMREVVNGVARKVTDDDGAAELRPYYNDLYDHALRASDWTDTLRDMITSIFETNMQLNDTRMNNIMKKLTAWAAIIAVPTAVTGYFGQNVPYPGFAKEWGFLTSVVVIVVIAGLLYLSFKKRDWL